MDLLWELQGKRVIVTYRGMPYKGVLLTVDLAEILLQTPERQLSLSLSEVSDVRADSGGK